MSRHGVRVGQHIVLTVLWEQDGLTPGEIARRLGSATPTVVNTATRMEEAGLVVRRPDPADARLVRLCEVAQSTAYGKRLSAIPGYDPVGAGDIRYDPEPEAAPRRRR